MQKTRVNLIGKRFGKLVVSKSAGWYSTGETKWLCICDCGAELFAKRKHLNSYRDCCNNCRPKRNSPYEDFSGSKIGMVTVLQRIEDKISKTGNLIIQWMCVCDCGEPIIRTSRLLRRGNCSCEKCRHKVDREKFCKWHEEIPSQYWTSVCRGAYIRKIEIKITQEYAWSIFLGQNRKCALSGVDIVFAKTKKEQISGVTTASLDRIDSKKGYIEGNIQWLHKWVNNIKSDFTQEEFIDLCHKVSSYNKK